MPFCDPTVHATMHFFVDANRNVSKQMKLCHQNEAINHMKALKFMRDLTRNENGLERAQQTDVASQSLRHESKTAEKKNEDK